MAGKKMTRREFIVGSAIGVAGTVALGGVARAAMMGGGGGGIGGSGTIDPPPGALFTEPPLAKTTVAGINGRRVVYATLEAKQAQLSVNGTPATLLTYNGSFPGPTIGVKANDILHIDFINSLPANGGTNILGHPRYTTNLHTHGLHVSPSGNADNVMRMFEPGMMDYYEYDLAKHPAGTLNFYHPHVHGSVAEQYWGGMVGALVVEDPTTLLSGFETHTMILKDITLSGGVPEPYSSVMEFMHGKEGSTVMVNGQVNPVLPTRPGQVQRWRIVNASNARFYHLSLEGHTFQVIGTEGGLLDKPYPQTRFLLSPGERVDLLVKASATQGAYRLLAIPYARQGSMASASVTLLTLQCSGTGMNDAIPATIEPAATRLTMDTAKLTKRTLTLSMGQGRGYINGISFQDMNNTAKIHSTLGTYELWEIVNNSGMDHPFHQHVNHCQVLSVSGGDAGYASFLTRSPAWKDTVLIPKWGRVTMLVPVMDYDGMTMFHCHIIEHEDIGMMGVWMIMPAMM